jgi:hypothetical protein
MMELLREFASWPDWVQIVTFGALLAFGGLVGIAR